MATLIPTIEAIRTKGQVWTPSWVADAMAVIIRSKLTGEILDPAVGPGALVAACKRLSNADLKVTAYEIDESVLATNHSETEFAKLETEIFISIREKGIKAKVVKLPFYKK
jgi:predicted RNA methylase